MYIIKIQKINRLNICQKFESDCCLVKNLWLVLVLVYVPPLSQEEREARRTVVLPFFYNIIWCSSKCLQCNHTLMLPYKYIFSRMEPTTASPKQTFIRTVAPDLLPWYNMYKVGEFVSRMSGFSSIYSWCQQRMTKVLWLVCSL